MMHPATADGSARRAGRHALLLILALLLLPLLLPARGAGAEQYDGSGLEPLRWIGPVPPTSFARWSAKQTGEPFRVRRLDQGTGRTDSPANTGVLLLVNEGLRPSIEARLNRYAGDIAGDGWNPQVFETAGGSPEDLKSFIIDHSADLAAVVFFGRMPTPWYESDEEFPFDYFYMELDGTWIDADDDGMYDALEDGGGDQAPEIFVAHIDASMMTWWDEAEAVNRYLDKDHQFWVGGLTCTDYGLTYTEDDWASGDDICTAMRYGYPDYHEIRAPDTNRDDYVQTRLTEPAYEFVQLACHSWSGGHGFTRGGTATSWRVANTEPEALFYNLFCCSALRWIEENHLGGAYIFNSGATSLATVGSTKSGSMLNFSWFYEPFGSGASLGQSLRLWFEEVVPFEQWEIDWHMGMSITGDPFVGRRGSWAVKPQIIVGPGPLAGQDPFVRGYGIDGAARPYTGFDPYVWLSGYGTQVAVGDLDGDGLLDIVTGTGPGPALPPIVRAYDLGGTHHAGVNFRPYGTGGWGVEVACGDLDGDGRDEIVTGPGPGPLAGPHVRGFSWDGSTVTPLPGTSFQAYGTLKYGVKPACGDIDGDGYDEIVTGAGAGAVFGPHVRGWNVDGGAARAMPGVSFFAYNTLRWGVNVACGDLDGDGIDEIVTAPGPGEIFGGHIRAWRVAGGSASPLPDASLLAYPADVRCGARVTCADIDGDGCDEIITAPGPGPDNTAHIRGFDYVGTLRPMAAPDFIAWADEGYRGGTLLAAVDEADVMR
jgi:hypothetical protein